MFPFQSSLPNNASEGHFGDVVAQCSRNRDTALPRRMMKLSMTASLATEEPTFTLEFSNNLTNLYSHATVVRS